jgi:hypothetical protein
MNWRLGRWELSGRLSHWAIGFGWIDQSPLGYGTSIYVNVLCFSLTYLSRKTFDELHRPVGALNVDLD